MTTTTKPTARRAARDLQQTARDAEWAARNLPDLLMRNARLEKRVADLEAHLGLTAKPARRAKAAR